MHLACALEYIDSFLGRDDRIAVEIGGALLEFSEVLDGFERSL